MAVPTLSQWPSMTAVVEVDHLTKRYAVKIQGVLAEDSPLLEQLRDGLDIGEGEITLPAHVSVTRIERNTWLEVIITEGRNRQIRRMFDAIGHPVMKLRRIGIGPLSIEGLRSGTYRSLALNEVLSIYEDMETEAPEAATPSKRQLKREAQERERDGDKPRARSVGGGRAAGEAVEGHSPGVDVAGGGVLQGGRGCHVGGGAGRGAP